MGWSISRLADAAGVRASAIRYYERRGLMPIAARKSGRRRYGPDDLNRLSFIVSARRAGLQIDDIAVAMSDAAQARTIAAARLAAIEAEMARLSETGERLRAALDCSCIDILSCRLTEGGGAA